MQSHRITEQAKMAAFSDHAVWCNTTRSGFRQQAFIMYHGTKNEHTAARILQEGFRVSTGQDQMLGNGIYVSATKAKARRYGRVTLKLLVYPGRVKRINYQGHPQQKTWQENYSSAWVPPLCGMVPSGLQVKINVHQNHDGKGQPKGIAYYVLHAGKLRKKCLPNPNSWHRSRLRTTGP